MKQSSVSTSRKKFLTWGATILASLTALRFLGGSGQKEKNTVKMLSQDGQLVEIDERLLAQGGKKVTNNELQNWIKK